MRTITILPNRKRGITAVALLCTMVFLNVFIEIRSFYLKNYVFIGISNSIDYQVDSDWLNRIVVLILFVTYILTIIFYLRWFSRAYQNIQSLGHVPRYSKNISVGVWFIPVFHWIAPIQMMLDIYRFNEKILFDNSAFSRRKNSYFVIYAWWALYILGGLDAIIHSFGILPNQTGLAYLSWKGEYLLFNMLLNLFLTIMAAIVVNNYMNLELKITKLPFVKVRSHKENLTLIDDGVCA